MFEESDDDERPRDAAEELDQLGQTVTGDASELNQLLRSACANLGGPMHVKADQTIGLIVSAHAVRLLPTLWTVLLQKLRDCATTGARVAVVAHFANVCNRIAARQRGDAFRVFAKDAMVLFGTVEVVADRRFVAAVQTILTALGVHAAPENCEPLQEKLLQGFFTWTRQDARRNAAVLAVGFSRWTRHCGRVVDLFETAMGRDGADAASIATLLDQGMPSLVAQSENVACDTSVLSNEPRVIAKAADVLLSELESPTSATCAASIASAIVKGAAAHKLPDGLGPAVAEALTKGVKPMLLCPLLSLLKACLRSGGDSLLEEGSTLARRFMCHSDMLVRQCSYALLAETFQLAKASDGIDASAWSDELPPLADAFRLYAVGEERCATTLASIADAAAVAIPLAEAEAAGDILVGMVAALDTAEALATALPVVRERVLLAIASGAVPHGRTFDAFHRQKLVPFLWCADSWSTSPAVAVAAVQCCFANASVAVATPPPTNALGFIVEGVPAFLDHAGLMAECEAMPAVASRLLEIAEGLACTGDGTSVRVAAAMIAAIAERVDESPSLRHTTLQALGVADALIAMVNSPATSSVEVTCELLRAIQSILPLGPEEDMQAEAFRLCGTLLRRCCLHLEPAVAATSPRRPAARVAGTLLEDIVMVEELTASLDSAAQAHLSNSDSAGSVFGQLVTELLNTMAVIAYSSHGLFRDALQLQCAPVVGYLETAATIAPVAAVECGLALFDSLFAELSTIVTTEKVTPSKRRVRFVQLLLPTLNRALAYDMTVVGTAFLAVLEALATADAAEAATAEESCYLAFDPELKTAARLVELVADEKTACFIRGPTLLAALTVSLEAILPVVKRVAPTVVPESMLKADCAAAALGLANAVYDKTGGDAFLAILGASPAEGHAVTDPCAVARRTLPLLELATRSPAVQASLSAIVAGASCVDPDVLQLMKLSGVNIGALDTTGSSAKAAAAPPALTWASWADGATGSPQPAEPLTSAVAAKLSVAQSLNIWASGVPLPAPRGDVPEAPSCAYATTLEAAEAGTQPAGESFCSVATAGPHGGSLLVALPLEVLDREGGDLTHALVLQALRHATTPDELEMWLAAAAALAAAGSDYPPSWARLVVRAAAAQTFLMVGQVRSDSTEQLSGVAEFLADTAATNRARSDVRAAVAVVIEWLKPGRCGLWCWEDAWEELPGAMQVSVMRCFRALVGAPDDADKAAICASVATELLGRARTEDPFHDSTLLVTARCLSGSTAAALVSSDAIPLANPRVFDVVTEVIYTVGINADAAQTLHAEITPMLVDPSVTQDADFRDAVLRCSAGLGIALAEERRTRPPAHSGISDLQALFDDYPLKRMTAEGAESIFDAVHDATFAPFVRADRVPVRHWNQFRRCSLALCPAENTVDPATRDRLCTSILNFVVPMVAKGLDSDADVRDVWMSLDAARLLAFKCGSQLRRTHLMDGGATAAAHVLERCTELCHSEFASEILKGSAAQADQAQLESWCGLPLARKSTVFHDTHAVACILVVFSAGLRSVSDSDRVKATANPAVVVRAALRFDWLHLGSGLCALTGFASGPKADQKTAASFFAERVQSLLLAANSARHILSSAALLTLRTGFAFMVAMPDDPFVTSMTRHALRHVAGNSAVRSVRLRAYAFFMLQSIIGMQAVSDGSTQWAALRKSLRDATEATMTGGAVTASALRLAGPASTESPNGSNFASARSLPSNRSFSDAMSEDDGSESNMSFGAARFPRNAVKSATEALQVVATEATFVLRALTSYAGGDERDRTTSTVLDLLSALRQRDGFSAPHSVVVLRLLSVAMPANERVFLALNQFSFTPLGQLTAVDALAGTIPPDMADLLSQLNLLVSCVSQHCRSVEHVWWLATTVLWMATYSVDRHVHRAVGRLLVETIVPRAVATLGRATSLWLGSVRPSLQRSVLTVFDQQGKSVPAEVKDQWRTVSAGLRA